MNPWVIRKLAATLCCEVSQLFPAIELPSLGNRLVNQQLR